MKFTLTINSCIETYRGHERRSEDRYLIIARDRKSAIKKSRKEIKKHMGVEKVSLKMEK